MRRKRTVHGPPDGDDAASTGAGRADDDGSAVLDLARALVARASVTPDDAGCQDLVARRLLPLGFASEWLRFGEVTNLWARRGERCPLFVFLGHTDVVPPGPAASWSTPPFEPVVRDGLLHGRGAADMKGSIAAFVVALERFLRARPDHPGSVAMLLTSDEEGPGRDGTRRVVETLCARGVGIDWCLVGEPTSGERLGDTLKNGRRGSLNGHVRVRGVQGHVAYPDRTVNAVHGLAALLADLASASWDEGGGAFPPTTFQVSNVSGGTGAVNVVPGEAQARFNFRYSTALTHEELIARVEDAARRHRLDFAIEWQHSGAPFLTEGGALVETVRESVRSVTGLETTLSTSGGTSDGRFVAPTGAQVVELGPCNATIHQVDERVAVADLETLARVYEDVLRRLLA